MAIASRLKWFLDVNQVQYDLVDPDEKTERCPDDQLVVSRLFHDAQGYLMVVHSASHKVATRALQELVGRPLHPAKPSQVRDIFFDCPKGVVPPIGGAYGVPSVVDERLPSDGDLYFCAGDEQDLVHMKGAEFQGLVADAPHGAISQAPKSA
jgi:Ala-tRNA(Pro) deacylase